MGPPATFVCEIDDCMQRATVILHGQLLCTHHALPFLRPGERRVEAARAEWLEPEVVRRPQAQGSQDR